MTNELAMHHHLGGSTFILRGNRSDFKFLYIFIKILKANRIALDGTPRSASSHMGLYRLPITKTCPCNIMILLALKIENFQLKNFDIFLIFAQNIDCGYTLEPPGEAVLTSTHNLCFEQK